VTAPDSNAVLALVADRLQEAVDALRMLSRSSGTALPTSPESSKCSDVTSEHVNATEVAQIVGVEPRTIRRWSLMNRMPRPMRVGNTLRWRRSTIELWMKERAR
jgi:predicted DNA-binding transcriptional regulator AlpA